MSRRVVGWIVGLLGAMALTLGMHGVTDADRYLRRQVEMQQSLIRHYENGHSAAVRADTEERLGRHVASRGKGFFFHSAVANVLLMVGGIAVVVFTLERRSKSD